MEFGPRALGHRSLLASATDPAINSDLTLGCKHVKLTDCYASWQMTHPSAVSQECTLGADGLHAICPYDVKKFCWASVFGLSCRGLRSLWG